MAHLLSRILESSYKGLSHALTAQCHKKAWVTFQVFGDYFLSQMEACFCLPVLPKIGWDALLLLNICSSLLVRHEEEAGISSRVMLLMNAVAHHEIPVHAMTS